MKKILIILFLLSTLMLSGKMEIIEQNAEQILLRISVDEYSLNEFNEFTELSFPDWNFTLDVGAPNLPVKKINIGVPPDGDIEVNIVSTKITTKNILKPVSPVPGIVESGNLNVLKDAVTNLDTKMKALLKSHDVHLNTFDTLDAFQSFVQSK